MKQRKPRELWRPDLMSMIPSSWLMVEANMKLFGGWSKFFSRSAPTYDEEVIFRREGDYDFEIAMAMAMTQEQFRADVLEAIEDFRVMYPEKKIKTKELKDRLALALLQSGWVPKQRPILKAIKDAKKVRKAEIRALRDGLTKSQWDKRLKLQRRSK
jgi:hypothetical protein